MNEMQNNIIFDDKFLTNRQALCIVACAGSGKTTTIIAKIKYMIEHLNCDPSEFVIQTFTNNATNDIIERIGQYSELTILTFHMLALKELIKYNYTIVPNTPEPIPEEYLIKYLKLLDDQSYVNRFKYIFIDEYQDINQYQYAIIKKWYANCKLLVVVGDDQQNIYMFRNTSIKYILNFCTDFNGEYKYLTINYRSNIGIVNLSNAIVKHNNNRIDKLILSNSNDKLIKPKVRFFYNQLDEYKYILKCINKIKESESIAILCRSNKKLYKLENFLNINQINSKYKLLTIHGSKGLEFDHVIIINCTDGYFPMIDSDIEEERRLFYVGCTRAKKTLLITSIWFDINIPSRFIYELYLDGSLLNINNFEWNIKYNDLTTNLCKSTRLDRLLSNNDIAIYEELSSNNLLPTIKQQTYKIINVHNPLVNIDNIRFDCIKLCIERLIYEVLCIDNYIYIEYLLNIPKFSSHSKLFKSNILKYLNDKSSIDQLESSLEYLSDNGITIRLIDKDMIKIADLIQNSYRYNLRFDHNILLNDSKTKLALAYIEFQNKQLKTIDILDSINKLSICKDLIKGIYASQSLINKDHSIVKSNIIIINDFLTTLIINATYVDYCYLIVIADRLIDKIDLIINNQMFIIVYDRPTIVDYIKYIIMIAKYNDIHKDINQLQIIKLYNPLLGIILELDIDFNYMNLYKNLILYTNKCNKIL